MTSAPSDLENNTNENLQAQSDLETDGQEDQEKPERRPVGCLAAMGIVLLSCFGIGIFAAVTETCDCAEATALRSSTVECYFGGRLLRMTTRYRDYGEVCLGIENNTTTDEDPEDEPEDVVVTCDCEGTTEVCSDGTSTANAAACTPEVSEEVTCECDGTTEVCSDGSSTPNAEACVPDDPDDPEDEVVTCECDGVDEFCSDGTVNEEATVCLANCSCDGPDLFCEDGTVIENYDALCPQNVGGGPGPGPGPSTCNIELTCGDGVCNPACENSDLCSDCKCVDNGICEAGEGWACRDCAQNPVDSCGSPCPTGTCSNGLSCTGQGCWGAVCDPVVVEDPGGGGTVCANSGISYCTSDGDCGTGEYCTGDINFPGVCACK